MMQLVCCGHWLEMPDECNLCNFSVCLSLSKTFMESLNADNETNLSCIEKSSSILSSSQLSSHTFKSSLSSSSPSQSEKLN